MSPHNQGTTGTDAGPGHLSGQEEPLHDQVESRGLGRGGEAEVVGPATLRDG